MVLSLDELRQTFFKFAHAQQEAFANLIIDLTWGPEDDTIDFENYESPTYKKQEAQ